MRKLIATVFNYSLDGLLADEDTEFWKFCFDLPENREPDDPAQLDFLRSAHAHIMGRTAYEGIAAGMTRNPDHAFAPILNAARKVVFSRTLKTADWTNTTIAAGDTAEEIDALQVSMFPYIAGEGTRLFDGVPTSYALELVSCAASRSGIVELQYRRAGALAAEGAET
jgi:dihydrofolate reductase